jgi:hypothetical protein
VRELVAGESDHQRDDPGYEDGYGKIKYH